MDVCRAFLMVYLRLAGTYDMENYYICNRTLYIVYRVLLQIYRVLLSMYIGIFCECIQGSFVDKLKGFWRVCGCTIPLWGVCGCNRVKCRH